MIPAYEREPYIIRAASAVSIAADQVLDRRKPTGHHRIIETFEASPVPRNHHSWSALLLAVACQLSTATAVASTRWDLLNWCQSADAAMSARCDGLLHAALDLNTHPDFTPNGLCFPAGTQFNQVRTAVVDWLKKDRTAPEKSGLGLASKALQETYPCGN